MNIEKNDIKYICPITGMQKRMLSQERIREKNQTCSIVFERKISKSLIEKQLDKMLLTCDSLKSVIVEKGLTRSLIIFLKSTQWTTVVNMEELKEYPVSLEKQPWILAWNEDANEVVFVYNSTLLSECSVRKFMTMLAEGILEKGAEYTGLPFGGKVQYDKALLAFNARTVLAYEQLECNCERQQALQDAGSTKEYIYEGRVSDDLLYAVWANVMFSLHYTKECVIGIVNEYEQENPEYMGKYTNVFPCYVKASKDDTLDGLAKQISLLSKVKDLNDFTELYHEDFCFRSSIEITEQKTEQVSAGYTLSFGQKSGLQILAEYKSNLHLSVTKDKDFIRYCIIWNKEQYSNECVASIISMFQDTLAQVREDSKVSLGNMKYSRYYQDFSKYSNQKESLYYLKDNEFGGRTALIDLSSDTAYTFAEFNLEVNKISRYLRKIIYQGMDIEANQPVIGVCMNRSVQMLAVIYAIMKSGGIYMPIDPQYPKNRVRYMMENSKCLCVISDEEKEELGFMTYHSLLPELEKIKPDETVYAKPEKIAYLLYTSGSTGNPKGVLIPHKAIENRIDWIVRYADVKDTDCMLFKTPYTFDVSVIEILIWKYSGCKLCILPPEEHKNPEKIRKAIKENQVTIVHFVPSMLKAFAFYAESVKEQDLGSLRYIFTSGEALEEEHISQVKKTFDVSGFKILNLYGPTEAAVDVTYYECDWERLEEIPIGKAIDNVALYCLDEFERILPPHVAGQVAIAGIALLKGYLNDDEKTAQKVIMHSVLGDRMYLTGDKAYYRADGNLMFIGRIDTQVKIRGQRIELGEIKSVILKNDKIKDAQVIIVKEENPYIAAFLVAKEDMNQQEIMDYMKKDLAEYMVPQKIVFLNEIPTSLNGKCDIKKLEAMLADDIETKDNLDELTAQVKDIWKKVIGAKVNGVKADFFHAGGDSIKAIYLQTLLNNTFHAGLTLEDIFDCPTMEAQASLLKKRKAKTITETGNAVVQGGDESACYDIKNYPVNATQQRMYFMSVYNHGTAYNITGVYKVESGKMDLEKAENSFNKLMKRHAILRTSYTFEEDTVMAHIQEKCHIRIETQQFNGNQSIEEIMDKSVTEFDYKKAPLIRIRMIQIQEQDYFVVELSHIIADGISLSILMEEFKSLYSGQDLTEHRQIPYYSIVEQSLDKGDFWKQELQKIPEAVILKEDYKRPEQFSFQGDSVFSRYDIEAVKAFADSQQTTPAAVVLSALAVVLWKLSKSDSFIIGVVTSGRSSIEAQKSVGPFVNTLPVYFEFSQEQTKEEIVEYTSKKLRNALLNQDYPVDLLVEQLGVKRIMGENPLFNVMFTYISDFFQSFELPGVELSSYPYSSKTAKVDVSLFVHETNKQIELEYCTDLFDKDTICKLLERLKLTFTWLMGNSSQNAGEFSVLLDQEKQDYYGNNLDLPVLPLKAVTLQEQFEEMAITYPERIALKTKEEEFTYAQIQKMSDSLASYLEEKGAKPSGIVGIRLNNTKEVCISILAVLKTGAAYVPIDTNVPEERAKFMLRELNADILICEEDGCDYEVKEHIRRSQLAKVILEKRNFDIHKGERSDLAYVIFTSGSTGKPKGCLLSQGNVMDYVNWAIGYYFGDYESTVYFPFFTSISVDLTVTSIFTPLLSGNTVVIYENRLDSIFEIFRDGFSNIVKLTPSHIKLLSGFDFEKAKIRKIIVGGEQLLKSVCDLVKIDHVRFYNEYGPTETTVGCMIYEYEAGKSQNEEETVPIGRALPHTRIYLVDKTGGLCPQNVPGEIYIGGTTVAKGYTDEELTQKMFIMDPFQKEKETVYRTGDFGYYSLTGDIVYIGRADSQKKVRGHRIELEEIESSLQNSNIVSNSFVHIWEDEIIAVVVANESFAQDKLRTYLRKWLPHYMMPSRILVVEEMPMMLSGKIDIKRIEELISQSVKEQEVLSEDDDIQDLLYKVWKNVLQRKDFSVKDNFFEVGGNSFLLMKVHEEIKERFPYMQLMDYFKYPSIADLAAYIREQDVREERANRIPDLKIGKQGGKQYSQTGYELSFEMLDSIKETAAQYHCKESQLIAVILYAVLSEQAEDSRVQIAIIQNGIRRYICGEKSTDIEEIMLYIQNASGEKVLADDISIAVKEVKDTECTDDIAYIYDKSYGLVVEYDNEKVNNAKLREISNMLMDILEG